MCKVVEVLPSLSSVRDDDGAPTGVMIFNPHHVVGGKVVGVGAITKPDGSKEYGVVIDDRMLPKHRSAMAFSPSDISIRGEGKKATVHLHGVAVRTVKIS